MKTKPAVRYKHKNSVCIYMPDVISPDEREETFERPLSRVLVPKLAHVDGGGTWLGAASDVWIYTSSLKYALPVIRSFLLGNSVPEYTQVQYSIAGVHYYDSLVDGEWEVAIRSAGYYLGLSLGA